MTDSRSPETARFDASAANYDEELAQGLSVSGEDKNYFAEKRVAWLGACLAHLLHSPRAVLDFGCGTGSAAPFLLQLAGVDSLLGVDVSAKSVERARLQFGSARARFLLFSEHHPSGSCDLAFCNGVFHHIPPAERPAALDYIHRSLKPGGLFAFWENNPWNPGTRYVMSRIPFDADAILLWPGQARRLLRSAGFDVLRTDFLFLFPRVLRYMRGLEPFVSRLPLGAQYLVLGRRR